MAKDKLGDLNDHLFTQIERLNDEDDISKADLDKECKRAAAISKIASQILSVKTLQLKAIGLMAKGGIIAESQLETFSVIPKQITN